MNQERRSFGRGEALRTVHAQLPFQRRPELNLTNHSNERIMELIGKLTKKYEKVTSEDHQVLNGNILHSCPSATDAKQIKKVDPKPTPSLHVYNNIKCNENSSVKSPQFGKGPAQFNYRCEDFPSL